MALMPTQLRCECRDDPVGIDVAQPRLSWVLLSSSKAARGAKQTAYQVRVFNSAGEIWDSGKVDSPRTTQVAYAGRALASAEQVEWRVRVWDEEGRASNWSDPATWTMGLLTESDWRAKWIAAGDDVKSLPIFRRAFAVEKPIRRAIAFLCGLGQHELRVNDRKAGDDFLEPGWTNYARTCLYVAHDVTPLLKRGENVLNALLGNGMYNVTGGRYKKFKGSFGPPKLICHLRLDYADGTSDVIASDESWQVAPGPITFSCIYGGEDYDARLERIDEAAWKPAVMTNGPGGALRSSIAPPIRAMRTLKPARFTRPREGVHVYDLAQNISGYPKVAVAGAAGTKVTLTTGELLDADGLVSQKNTGSPVNFNYTLRGGGQVEHWHPRFSYTGFRYVQVEGAPLMELEADWTFAAAPSVGSFSCSNNLFNRIHDLINAAIVSNFQSVLTDCPHREKLGWLEQSHLMAESILFNCDAATFYAKIARDIRDAQHSNGCVPTIAPQYTTFGQQWDVFNDSPEWGSAAVINPWLIYQRCGDRVILEENYDVMARYVDYLHSRENEGLIDFGLGDWYDIGEGDPGFSKLTSKAVTATAIYYRDVTIMRQTAKLLGCKDDVARYDAHADRIYEAFNSKLFDKAGRQYDRGSQTAQAMPLTLGLVDAKERAAVLEKLVRDIRRRENHITAGDIGFRFVLQALADAGRSDVIFDLLSRTDPPSYGSQLERGATTLTEAWDANPKNSQNHLMLGHAEQWFYERLAGIRVDFSQQPPRQIVIEPTPVGDITWARASYESVVGTIAVRWEKQPGGAMRISATIPPNQAATIVLPVTDAASIKEAGKPVARAAGVRGVNADGKQKVSIVVESGDFVFDLILND